jgi:guanylate kinase
VNARTDRPSRGRLIVLSAPSGAGKTTIARNLMARDPAVRFSISYTTRPPRGAEQHGRDYFFVERDEFARLVASDAFLEHAEVFGHCYGTGRDHVESLLADGSSVLLDIDWQGARQVVARMPAAITVFVFPPSMQELERRLRERGTDAAEAIARRLDAARTEMSHWNEFAYLLVNDDADMATDRLADIVAGRGAEWRSSAQATVARAILGP